MPEESNITINNRCELNISGVDGITAFSENEAVLSTELGYLAVSGSDLHIDEFDRSTGAVVIKGKINAVFYPGGKKKETGFLKRLFGDR